MTDRNLEVGQHAVTIDPICEMVVDPHTAAASVSRGGVQYFFCSKGCAQRFESDSLEQDHAP